MSEKIGFITDSASDVPTSVLAQLPPHEIVPLRVTLDQHDYLDRITITPQKFYDLQQTATTITTASPVIGDVVAALQRLAAQGITHVIGVTISSGLSVTHQVFVQAAAMVPELTITILDSKSVGIGSGLFVVRAGLLWAQGDDYATICRKLEQAVTPSSVYFHIPSLTYLRAGGRIGKVAGLVGSLLHIQPVITCDQDGIYTPVAKGRSEAKAIQKMLTLVEQQLAQHPDCLVGVAEGANLPLQQQLLEHLKPLVAPDHLFAGDISPALGVHTGPGLVGIGVQTLS